VVVDEVAETELQVPGHGCLLRVSIVLLARV
jgi:hypothetical protein